MHCDVVTDFGTFVDIGVHQDGLVHISQLSNKFVKHPREVVSPGNHVNVNDLEITLEERQIALTMKTGPASQSVAGASGTDTLIPSPFKKQALICIMIVRVIFI